VEERYWVNMGRNTKHSLFLRSNKALYMVDVKPLNVRERDDSVERLLLAIKFFSAQNNFAL
jgi:hypothetical protein